MSASIRVNSLVPSLVAVALSAACAGKAPPAESASAAAAPSHAPLPEGLGYKDMTKEQRGQFMVEQVMPAMKPLFQEFDGKEFATFTCGTCHGSGVKDHSFTMPAAEVPSLPAPEDFMPYMEQHAAWVQFMGEKVTPVMAQLLGKEAFNPATHTGDFSCSACHKVEAPKSAAK